MGLIREPLDVDFVVEPRMLTEAEKQQISAYIKKCKTKDLTQNTVKRKSKAIKSHKLI